MSNRTNISWCDETWNPFVGCTPISPACANCYAQDMAARIVKMAAAKGKDLHYANTIREPKGRPVWTGQIAQATPEIRFAPLTRNRKSTRSRDIFVGSMSDFWHAGVPRAWQIEAFAVAALTPRDRFLFLTKRADAMRAFIADPQTQKDVWTRAAALKIEFNLCFGEIAAKPGEWPLHNVALGVTAEDQERADLRIPELLATPAAWRFVSCEPLLGEIDLSPWLASAEVHHHPQNDQSSDAVRALVRVATRSFAPRLDFVIAGGESGKDARFTHPDHVRSLRDQCAAACVAFHFKQWGEWLPVEINERGKATPTFPVRLFETLRQWDGRTLRGPGEGESVASFMRPGQFAVRAGANRSGNFLDGREHRDRLPAIMI